MACFLIPAAEAAVLTVVTHTSPHRGASHPAAAAEQDAGPGIPLRRALRWLTSLLWGGSALLAFEHVWHGEVTPWFPFLTAAANPSDTQAMLHEMATVGVGMAVAVTAVWAVVVLVATAIVRRAPRSAADAEAPSAAPAAQPAAG